MGQDTSLVEVRCALLPFRHPDPPEIPVRTRNATIPAVLAAAALTVVPALPAAAATITWTQPGDSWWSTATWVTAVPAAGDDVVFDGGPRSTYNLGDVTFGAFQFESDHQIASGGGTIALAGGITVAPGIAARIDPNIQVAGAQTWSVAPGSTLHLPSWITTDGIGTLELAIDGELALDGNLDALGTGAVVQTGDGIVVRSGGAGGGIGAGGYDIASGAFRLNSAVIAGTDVQATGGTLDGAGTIGAFSLDAGVLAPGIAGGTEVGIIDAWRNVNLDGGTYRVSVDPTSADSDLLIARANTTGTGVRLDVQTTATPAVGDTFTIIQAVGGTIDAALRLLSPTGDVLGDGDEFASDGSLWQVAYVAGADGLVSIEYLGEAPTEPAPSTPGPAAPQLASTGIDVVTTGLIAVVAVAIALAGAVILIGARRARRQQNSAAEEAS